MKKILITLFIALSNNAWSYDNPQIKSKCYVPEKPNQIHSCIISSGGGAGGMYTSFQIGKQNYHVEESTMCENEDRCKVSFGSDVTNMLDAKIYYRSLKTNKVMNEPKKNNWVCYKQLNGNLHACYLL